MTSPPSAPDPLPVPAEIVANLRSAWEEVAAPGASFTGEQRVAITAEARRAWSGEAAGSAPEDAGLPPAAGEAARRLAASPHGIRRPWVEDIVGGGLGYAGYVEIVGIVSRVVASDTFTDALGLAGAPLPDPRPGPPSGEIAAVARPGQAWVPMVGATSITQALSLVPAENAALERYHGPMYLAFEEMADPAISRALTRPQMEFVAARTSAVNECFY
ncbi:MAG: hypothetical protein KJ698_13440 [Actinobacteria bacterium]|nr:hypothetical protein [Actinomycetota bacterium]MBU1494852.1 hypothetical protein [Actinomycetota bacterium]